MIVADLFKPHCKPLVIRRTGLRRSREVFCDFRERLFEVVSGDDGLWPGSLVIRPGGAVGEGRAILSLREFPVRHPIPPGAKKRRAIILVVKVVGVFPQIADEQGGVRTRSQGSPVVGCHHGENAPAGRKPNPAGTEMAAAGVNEGLSKRGQIDEHLIDRIQQGRVRRRLNDG